MRASGWRAAAVVCGVLGGCVVWLSAPAGALAETCSPNGGNVKCVFDYTGSEQTFVVPAGLASCQGSVGSGQAIDTSTLGDHTFTVTTADRAGNTATRSVSYVVDGPPSALVRKPASGGIYARGQVVSTSFACAEGAFGPGLSQCVDSNGVAAGGGSALSRSGTGKLDTTTLGPHTYSANASSADGLGGRRQISYTVAAPPTITITSPVKGVYQLGQLVTAGFRCKDGRFGTGIKSCTGTVRKHAQIPTLTLGRVKFTVTAVSRDGQRASKTITYKVALAPAHGMQPGQLLPATRFVVDNSLGESTFTALTEFKNTPPPPQCGTSNKVAGCVTPPATIVLGRGFSDSALNKWWARSRSGSAQARLATTLTLYSGDTRLQVITLQDAWVSKLNIVSAKAGTNATATVNVTIRATAVSYGSS